MVLHRENYTVFGLFVTFFVHFDPFCGQRSQPVTHWRNPKPHNHHLWISNSNGEFNDQWNTFWCLTKSKFFSFVTIFRVFGPLLAFYGVQRMPKRAHEVHGNYFYTAAILTSFLAYTEGQNTAVRLYFSLHTAGPNIRGMVWLYSTYPAISNNYVLWQEFCLH